MSECSPCPAAPLSDCPSFSLHCPTNSRHLHPFPTRRSSDLPALTAPARPTCDLLTRSIGSMARSMNWRTPWTDRNSTRLNSSHLGISYAVFCLKKKKEQEALFQSL